MNGEGLSSGFHPKKSLGQHFLWSRQVLGQVVKAAEIQPSDVVVEIGPGQGSLTRLLAKSAARVVAVEIDEVLAHKLRHNLATFTSLEVIQDDILSTDIAALARVQDYKVVGNIPYYITSAVLRQILESKPPPALVVVMVQKEVAERITAAPGAMSLLTVSVQFYGEPRIMARVPATAFHPPPKVDSAILRIEPRRSLPIDEPEIAQFFRVVRAGFSQRRKQLRNSLASGLRLPWATLDAALTQVGVDGRRRAQTLSVGEWVALHQALTMTRRNPET